MVTVNDLDLLSDPDLPKNSRVVRNQFYIRCLSKHLNDRYMVDFQTIRQVTNSYSFLESSRHNNHLVTPCKQTLRQVVHVSLDAAFIWVEEVRDDADV